MKPTLHGIFDRVQLRSGSEENRTFFVFYKVRLAQPGKLELKILDPVGQEIAIRIDNWESGGAMTQWAWGFPLRPFKQNGTYTFELWDSATHRLAYTDLPVERI
ncbi:MAG: hypothetical protein ACRD3D_18285 [Terriglobia bacterium]